MLPKGTRVLHNFTNGHGEGTVVGHNGVRENRYFKEKPQDAAKIAGATGLLPALVNSIYDGERYPNVVQWDNGYKDVYADSDLKDITKLSKKEDRKNEPTNN